MFLLPGGIYGLWILFNEKRSNSVNLDKKTRRFIQIFTLFLLAFFGIYSFNHHIKLDWIGPGLLIVPWVAVLISKSRQFEVLGLLAGYFYCFVILL